MNYQQKSNQMPSQKPMYQQMTHGSMKGMCSATMGGTCHYNDVGVCKQCHKAKADTNEEQCEEPIYQQMTYGSMEGTCSASMGGVCNYDDVGVCRQCHKPKEDTNEEIKCEEPQLNYQNQQPIFQQMDYMEGMCPVSMSGLCQYDDSGVCIQCDSKRETINIKMMDLSNVTIILNQ